MPYVRRDATGEIVAVSVEQMDGFDYVGSIDPRIAEFERRIDAPKSRLHESDREVVRVLDDLVNVLIDKNLIRFTDLPAAAQHKLIERRGLRECGAQLGLLDDDTGLL
jgi:hypothetical protein